MWFKTATLCVFTLSWGSVPGWRCSVSLLLLLHGLLPRYADLKAKKLQVFKKNDGSELENSYLKSSINRVRCRLLPAVVMWRVSVWGNGPLNSYYLVIDLVINNVLENVNKMTSFLNWRLSPVFSSPLRPAGQAQTSSSGDEKFTWSATQSELHLVNIFWHFYI